MRSSQMLLGKACIVSRSSEVLPASRGACTGLSARRPRSRDCATLSLATVSSAEAQVGTSTLPKQGTTANRGPEASTSQPELRRDQVQVCDKIIAIFRAKPSSEWRKLIAFSKQWTNLSDSLFARLESRLKNAEDQKEKSDLKKLNRKLREVHNELEEHNRVLKGFLVTPEAEWEGLVASGRGSLSLSFFQHLENLVRATQDDIPKRDELARIVTRLLMLVDALDKVVADQSAMEAAGQEFKNLLETVTSMEEADARIDQLAKNGKLDPALMLTMTKAYAAAKDTDYTKEQVKDVMAHLYHKAKESFVAQQPASVRILKHLLWIESPTERREAMDQAFSPGPSLTTPTQDYLYTTPQELAKLMQGILTTYDASVRQSQSQAAAAQTQGLLNPQVIDNMRNLLAEVRKHYL